MTFLQSLAEQYTTGLETFAENQAEEFLIQAFQLGRASIEGQVGLLDIALIHQRAIERMLAKDMSPENRSQMLSASRTFLLECLAPFEMALRGFRDANNTLQSLNKDLEERIRARTASLVKTNALLKQEVQQRRRSERALHLNAKRLKILHGIDQSILSARSPAEIADTVLQEIEEVIPCERASVAIYDLDSDQATVLAVHSKRTTHLDVGARYAISDLVDIETLRRGDINHVEDILSLPKPSFVQQLYYSEGVRSYINIPLIAGGALIGAFNLGSGSSGGFPPKLIAIASEIADQLAIASESARLLEIERRRTSELEALRQASLQLTSILDLSPVLQTILDYALQLIPGSNTAHLYLYDGEKFTFGAAIWDGKQQPRPLTEPSPNGLSYQAAQTGQRIVISDLSEHPLYRDIHWAGGLAVMPLRTGDRVRGIMSLGFLHAHRFHDHELRLLELLTDQAAIAIHNAQLYEEIQAHAEVLELRVAERTDQLRKAKERLEAIFDSSSDAIALCRADGMIYQTNPAFNLLLGASPDATHEYALTSLVEPDQQDLLAAVLRTVALREQPDRIEVTIHKRDGSRIPTDIALAPIIDDEEGLRIACSLRDMTVRDKLEHSLRDALVREQETRELKSRFTSMVSHEFRTPLAIIQSASDLLIRYLDRMTTERRQEQLEEIQRQVRGLTNLLDDILAISRAESVGLEFRPETIDLVALSQEAIHEIQQTTHQHRIVVSVQGDPEPAFLDPKWMRQAIRNLLTNAVKYTPSGGIVSVEVAFSDATITLRIRDQGIGIPEDDLKHLFTVFHRASNVGSISGTGLGLPILKQAIELHQGTISVDSAVGVGTTFTITLPRAAA